MTQNEVAPAAAGPKEETFMLTVDKRLVDSDVAVLSLAGRLTLGRDCQRVEWQVDDLLREGKLNVVFDLSALSFIDSAGLGMVMMCFGKLKKSGGSLRVAGAQGYVEKTFTMTHVNDVIELFPSVEAAAASFPNRPSSPPDSQPGPATEPPPR
jgi:anti-sigma B factor antagonist